MTNVAVLVGSLRKESLSRKVANGLAALTPRLKFKEIDIGGLSFFNEELEPDPPRDWRVFREQISAADAVLFVTPEYVRSVPGVLKNAIDIGSRPWREGVLVGKPAAVISVSVSALGGLGANHHLRQSLVSADMPTLAQPEAYIGSAASLFDVDGRLINESTRDFLAKFGAAFTSHIIRHRQNPDRYSEVA